MPQRGPSAALRVRDLRKTYKDVVAVDGLALEVRAGECFGLLGPNGAGKTTTIEICEGLTEPDSGDVEVLGLRWSSDARILRQRLGIQLQETQLSDKLTVLETLELFRSFFTRGPRPDAVIALVQLEEKRNARVNGLSGGKRRLALRRALVGDRIAVPRRADDRARSQAPPFVGRSRDSGRPDGPSCSRRIT